MGLELVCLVSLCLAGTHHYACRSAVETTITASNHRPSGTGQACHRPYESLCHLNDCILGSKETWHMVRPWVGHTLAPWGNSMEMLRRKEGKRCKANNRLGRITFRAKNLSNVRSTYLGFFLPIHGIRKVSRQTEQGLQRSLEDTLRREKSNPIHQ
ncbi:hypothetical protein BO86DRAFT_189337 [Aspergillus japonicus CBS 114.51]|uniref:Uncharacterized protein n=1 Tax=Aspergillus japonicus CBS 114.51 TaxID=1448312 RepID=A0A8T8XAU9_ASPJA|nr:hypothetical protein BO86DRAFT_189337 [Aspergillus japonicus CBS 114.51]RAH85347.1 hypothetical protein BO86DRAFT_189337 [Aspergillus japonicus CBS 114.51]